MFFFVLGAVVDAGGNMQNMRGAYWGEWPLGGDGHPGPEVAPGRRLQAVGWVLRQMSSSTKRKGSDSLQQSV